MRLKEWVVEKMKALTGGALQRDRDPEVAAQLSVSRDVLTLNRKLVAELAAVERALKGRANWKR